MITIVDDGRSAVRYLRRRPLFALAVVGTLTAGVAVTSAAFGIARAVLWRPLPFDAAERLVFVWEETDRDGQRSLARVTGSRYAEWRGDTVSFASLSLFGAAGFTIETPQGAAPVRGVRVSAGYFQTLGIRAALGRTFRPEEDQPGRHRVVILSDEFWRERYGARPDAIGQIVRLSGDPYEIVGVMPRATFPAWAVNPATVTLDADSRQLWVPIPRTAQLDQSARAHVFGVVGRLAAGVTADEAAERLRASTDRTAADAHLARIEPLREQFVRDARAPLLALAGAALVALLIACGNLAALYASAFEFRRAELAVRAALGASVRRLSRQLVLEALVLATVGTAAGLLLARGALAALPRWLADTVPMLTVAAVDGPVVLFSAGLTVVAATVFTAWPIARLGTASTMPRGAAPRPRGTVHRVLVMSQVALTMGLAPTAALLAQSLRAVEREDAGFDIERVLVASVGLPSRPQTSPLSLAQAEQSVLAAVSERPNVVAAAAAYDHPLAANWSENPTVIGEDDSTNVSRQAELRIVSPGYFEAMKVAVREGRTLTDRDGFDAPGVAVINEAFARELEGRVLGRRLQTGTPRFMWGPSAANVFEIVGIVANERFRGLERPSQPAFYLSTRQFPQNGLTLLVRTVSDPVAIATDVRAALRAVDPAITFDRATSLERILATQLASRRVTTSAVLAFAVAALGLIGLGIYGLLTVLVNGRSHEIAVRLAVGASPTSVAITVVRDSLATAVAGVAAGTILSVIATRLVRHLLVGVSPTDAVTFAAIVTTILAIALCAALAPARRATHIDPIRVLRAP